MSEENETVEAFFLGPKSENEYWAREKIQSILDHWFLWRKQLFTEDSPAISPQMQESSGYQAKRKKISKYLKQLNDLLLAETPKYTPRYMGHMVSEISLPAVLGHFSALLHNPNNTSVAVARVGSLLEKEAIEMLAQLIGYDPKKGKGHFTSGGTVANFEAVWRARFRMDHWSALSLYLREKHNREVPLFLDAHMGWDQFDELVESYNVTDKNLCPYSMSLNNPWEIAAKISKYYKKDYKGPILLVPGSKHYSWQKACNIFGLGEESLWNIPLDKNGKIDCQKLKVLISKAHNESRPILMVVSVAGTTELAEIDPIDKVQDLLDQLKKEKGWDIWHHVDAAYGGFMCSFCHNEAEALEVISQEQLHSLKAISRTHSVTMDPHKLGYIPYSCGAFLAPNERNYQVSNFEAPYLKLSDVKNSAWTSTIEGSRSASGAAATWLTGKSLGFASHDFAQILINTFKAQKAFHEQLLKKCSWAYSLDACDTNILCFSIADKGDSLTSSNEKTLKLFDKVSISPNFSVSKTTLLHENSPELIENHVKKYAGMVDSQSLVLIRCVFMNPFWGSQKIGDKLRQEFFNEITLHKTEIDLKS